jgi:tetratricopeptide (TPR) repeat protein
VDVELFGLKPGGHHLVNFLFHVLNTILLLLVLHRATKKFWPCAWTAALFAIHPLHVESVAWIAERKDVLSAFFWLLTMGAYIRYVERPVWSRYFTTLFLFVLGLMSKPMLVTLPVILLVADVWPLERRSRTWTALIREKIPFLVFAGLSSAITIVAQRAGHSVASLDVLPLTLRVENALVSYVRYLKMTLVPSGLAAYYPLPLKPLPMEYVAASACLVLGISIAVWIARKSFPFLAAGWIWYLVTLLPVIGIIQVGAQSMADRYTYIPLIGIFFAAVWGVTAISDSMKISATARIAIGVSVVTAFSWMAWKQTGYWINSITLFEHTVNVTTNNAIAEHDWGYALAQNGNNREAIPHFEKSLSIQPKYYEGQYNLGRALTEVERIDEATPHFAEAVRLKPDYAEAHYAWATTLLRQQKFAEAEEQFSQALRYSLRPQYAADAHLNLGVTFAQQGKMNEALAEFEEGVRLAPHSFAGRKNLAQALIQLHRTSEARDQLSEALRISPGNPEVMSLLQSIP